MVMVVYFISYEMLKNNDDNNSSRMALLMFGLFVKRKEDDVCSCKEN
jgi:hypothetical protein